MKEQIKSGFNDLHTGRSIRTFKGHYVNVFDPDPDTIDIDDIAHALSNTCRFGGHTYEFFSVAQHSVMVARTHDIPEELKLTALLHDATEAYMCDLPRPIKRNIPSYKEAEDKLMQCIAEKFNLVYPFPAIIKKIDNIQLEVEHKFIIMNKNFPCSQPASAKTEFMYYFNLYTKKES